MTARERRRLLICILIAAISGALCALSFLFHFLPGVDQLQELATDATIFRSRDGNVARRVALVEIDDRTVSELRGPYGRVFSWPRSLHARVLRNLIDAGARVVVFDLLFDSPGCPGAEPAGCAEDAALAQAVAYVSAGSAGQGGRVVLALSGNPPAAQVPAQAGPFAFQDALEPLPALTAAGATTGHVQVAPDSDGTVRRLPLVVLVRDEPVPALSLQAAAAYLRRPRAFDGFGQGVLLFAGRRVPVDDYVQTRVNYAGPPSHRPAIFGAPTVPGLSYVDVLNGRFDRTLVADKAVFVGVTALGFADDFWAPTSRAGVKMTGVEIHAQAAEMLLQGSFLQEQGTASTILVILALSLLTGAVLARWQPVLAGLTALICFVLYIVAAVFYGWSSEQQVQQSTTFTILNAVFPGVAMLGTTVGVLLYRIVFEQAEQRATRDAMGKYLSPPVLDEVLRDPTGLRLGGQKREMSVLFSDIRGFTPLSEQVQPERLTQFLNEYLTAMTEVVFDNNGVLDKYMGDGIMAFWGAPGDQPDHARRACATAYEMVRRMRRLQPEWVRQGFPALSIGVGINSGVMTVGNVGSRQRFDYTVIGDAVNLAARLEEANKAYQTQIIIGEETRRLVGAAFVTRSLNLVALRGLERATAIHELLGPAAEVAADYPPAYLAEWEAAVQAFRGDRFAQAQAGFERCLVSRPDDGPGRLYLARCVAQLPLPDALQERIAR